MRVRERERVQRGAFTFQKTIFRADAGFHVVGQFRCVVGNYGDNCRRARYSPGVQSVENDSSAMRFRPGLHHCPLSFVVSSCFDF